MGTAKLKVEPEPRALSTQMSPPMDWTRLLQM